MSMVISLDQCIARPDEGEHRYPLVSHLIEVGQHAGDPHGDIESVLLFLAGLLHDAGKAQYSWQEHIRSDGARRGTVPHAFLGSALFTLFALELRKRRSVAPDEDLAVVMMILQLARDIADHHGELEDMEPDKPPWLTAWRKTCLEETDLMGLRRLVEQFIPDAVPRMEWTAQETERELSSLRKTWGRLIMKLGRLQATPNLETVSRHILRVRTGRLIAADRLTVANVAEARLSPDDAARALAKLQACCQDWAKQAHRPLTGERQRIQDEVTASFKANPNRMLYTLQLPTGLGKTLTSLRVALTACASGRTSRVIYVAPYLSILSQAADEIRRATGLQVTEHHHLSVLQAHPDREWEPRDLLTMESWEAPVIATTFNQFFRALFPRTAQHTIRLRAVREAFIIVDEPQIVDEEVWNLFLTLLEKLLEQQRAVGLLMTATMPPLSVLRSIPPSLAPPVASPRRYRVEVTEDKMDASQLARVLVQEAERVGSVAAILNTVRDATDVFMAVEEYAGGEVACINLHGAMHPLHKSHQIRRIQQNLVAGRTTIAVTTQIIEAGVDLSFRSIYRARPILPSIIQAAGRANRHAEEDMATVHVFEFLCEGKETRHYVYRESIAREVTDELLDKRKTWLESELADISMEYFEHLFRRKPADSALQVLLDAAQGRWSQLAGINPFKDDQPRVSVFVSKDGPWMDETTRRAMCRFGIRTVAEVYQRYLDRKWLMRELSFTERKYFMGLIQRFIVPLSLKRAAEVASLSSAAEEGIAICLALNPDDYSDEVGFGHLASQRDDWLYL